MVLCLKARESRSLPGQPRTILCTFPFDAGWSSSVARQAHNLKVTGSNPVPATKRPRMSRIRSAALRGGFLVSGPCFAKRLRRPLGATPIHPRLTALHQPWKGRAEPHQACSGVSLMRVQPVGPNRILVVEPDATTRELLADVLRTAGCEAVPVDTGERALTRARAERGAFAGLFAEVDLPGLVDGWIVADEFRSANPSSPIVLASDEPSAEVAAEGTSAAV